MDSKLMVVAHPAGEKEFSENCNLTPCFSKMHAKKGSVEKGIELQCEICLEYFKCEGSLQIHLENMHSRGRTMECDYPTVIKEGCSPRMKLVDRYQTDHKSVQSSRQNHYDDKSAPSETKRICPMCSFSTDIPSHKGRGVMYTHFQSRHGLPLKWETLQFSSDSDFYTWKCDVELTTASKFIKSYNHDTSTMCLTFVCHHSVIFIPNGSRKPPLNGLGSCNMIRYCPATIIKKIKTDGKIKVLFLNVHVGHDVKPRLLRSLNNCSAIQQLGSVGVKISPKTKNSTKTLIHKSESNGISDKGKQTDHFSKRNCSPNQVKDNSQDQLLSPTEFTHERNLIYHERRKLSDYKPSPLVIKSTCPWCGFTTDIPSAKGSEIMFTHFESEHSISIETLQFNTDSEFYIWKCDVEYTTGSKFIRSDRQDKNACIRFVCHRSRTFKSDEGRKQSMNVADSCNVNDSFCPATIVKKVESNGKIKVLFLNVHVGHNKEPRNIRSLVDDIDGKQRLEFVTAKFLSVEENSTETIFQVADSNRISEEENMKESLPKKVKKNIQYNNVSNSSKKLTCKRKLIHQEREKQNDNRLTSSETKKICPLCSFTTDISLFEGREIMFRHFESEHNILNKQEKLQFDDVSLFYLWKSDVEYTTASKFVESDTHDKTDLYSRFVCRQNVIFRSKVNGKQPKSLGSHIKSGFCPANIMANLETSGKVKVSFLNLHIGHNNDQQQTRS